MKPRGAQNANQVNRIRLARFERLACFSAKARCRNPSFALEGATWLLCVSDIFS